MSLVPAQLLAAFTSITPSKYPNPRDRSRLFDLALSDLVSWWYTAFEVVPHRALRRRRPDDVDAEVSSWADEAERLRARVRSKLAKADKAGREPTGLTDPDKIPTYPWDERPLLTHSQRTAALRRPDGQLPLTEDGSFIRAFVPAADTWEVLRPVVPPAGTSSGGKGALGSLYAAAAMLRGSADLQAQLLVALLRALDIPARLVVSLQAMEWRSKSQSGAAPKRSAGGSKAKEKGKGRARTGASTGASTDEDTGSAASASRSAAGRKKPPPGGAKGKGKKGGTETLVLSSTASEGEAGSGSASAGGRSNAGGSGRGGWVDGQGKLAYRVPKVNLRRSGGAVGKGGAKVPGWKKEEELRRGASPGASRLSRPSVAPR